jgi:hypothetical protein
VSEVNINTSTNPKKRKASGENSDYDIHNGDHDNLSTKKSPRNFWTSFSNFQKKNKKKKY